MIGEAVVLKRAPATGHGLIIRQSVVNPFEWLIEFVDGRKQWVNEIDFIIEDECARS